MKIGEYFIGSIHNTVFFALITEYAHEPAVVNAVADVLIAELRYIPLLHAGETAV